MFYILKSVVLLALGSCFTLQQYWYGPKEVECNIGTFFYEVYNMFYNVDAAYDETFEERKYK